MWFLNTLLHKDIQHFWHLPSCSSGWMRKHEHFCCWAPENNSNRGLAYCASGVVKRWHHWWQAIGNHSTDFEVNSLAPGKSGCDFKNSIFNLVSMTGICKTSYANILRWMPQDLTDGKSTLVQVMAWCRQAPSHYLSHCWPRSMTPNGVTRPQWVNQLFYVKCIFLLCQPHPSNVTWTTP